MLTGPRPAAVPSSFEIVDALTAVGPWRDRAPGQPYEFEDLLAEHERYGIGRRLLLHAEAREGVPDNGNANIGRITVLRDDTAPIWTVLPPRRFGGQRADRLLADAQAAGVAMFALFPETHGHHIAPWANGDLYGAMEQARLPLVLDIGNAQGAEARRRYEEVHAIATAHPRLPIVLWNSFYMDERLHVPLLDTCRNVRIGIATVFIPTWGIEQYTGRYGPDRLIFGSNWPRQSPGPLLTYVLYAEVDKWAKTAILGGTIRTLADEVRWQVRGFAAPPAKTGANDGGRGTESVPAPGAPPPIQDWSADRAQEWDAAAPSAEDAPWLEALAAERAEAAERAPRRTTSPKGSLDPRRAPGEEGE